VARCRRRAPRGACVPADVTGGGLRFLRLRACVRRRRLRARRRHPNVRCRAPPAPGRAEGRRARWRWGLMATRQAAIAERRRNVLVDAGAGTGKTSLVVERFVDMVAPAAGTAPVPIERLPAITFTRKAAGHLRLRIRDR